MEVNGGSSPNWTELTQECLIEIMLRLNLEQRWLGPMLVSKTWMKACQDPLINSVFDLETRFMSVPESVSWWTMEFEEKVDLILRSVVDWSQGGLKEIYTRHCSDRSISYVAERCPNLEVLCIKSCPNVTDATMIKIATNCPKLRELDISFSYGITHKSITMIGMHCQNVKILKRNLYSWTNTVGPVTTVAPRQYLAAPPKDFNMEPGVIARLMPQLKHLELQCSTIDVEGLVSICKGCPNLEYFDVYGCIYTHNIDISPIISGLKYLKEIKYQPYPILIWP